MQVEEEKESDEDSQKKDDDSMASPDVEEYKSSVSSGETETDVQRVDSSY